MLDAVPNNPVKLAQKVEGIVSRGVLRKYYRTHRSGKWYGGIATADCCGCNLKCVFCWSDSARDNPDKIGRFYSPEQIFNELTRCATRFRHNQLRLSGNEPTINKEHLLKLLELIDQTTYKFILESNGTLINIDYAKQLSRFGCIHARISIKGANPQEFTLLTGAESDAFNLQLNALRYLVDAGVSCHPAVMLSFSSRKDLEELKTRLNEMDATLTRRLEEEYVFLYPHVVKRLEQAGIKPLTAYEPEKVPKELI